MSVVKQDTGECRQDSTVPARSRVVHPDSLVGLCGVSVGVKQETVGVPTRDSASARPLSIARSVSTIGSCQS